MPTVLILGASRGIGRELARQYLADGWRVIATARAEAQRAALAAMGAVGLLVDVTSAESLAGLGWQLDGERLDAAWLVAGLYGPRHDGAPTEAEFDAVMHTNVLAALRVLPLVAPRLAPAGGKLAVLSSRMGSIGERSAANGSLYRASKAALNSVLKDISLVYGAQGVTCAAFHPGWVQTDMGGDGAALAVADSVADLRRTLARLRAADNGGFFNHDGSPIAW
ncbi:SDR family oxidoreductase [Massilia sp. DWR3-1-1]|uniref:SDR family oxidoreductase n=1 Tax=Massilia sp. DWR3-1-1 TaxID=2804559 RepID=UPI003CF14E84